MGSSGCSALCGGCGRTVWAGRPGGRLRAHLAGKQQKRGKKVLRYKMVTCQEENWEGLQFEHIDWNDIVEAELRGDSDALLLLK